MNPQDNLCQGARAQFSLLLYGELTFDEEERVESHLEACADCRAALERERELHAAFDRAAVEPPASLLMECRQSLRERMMDEAEPKRSSGWWDKFVDVLTLSSSGGWLRPAGALTLLAIGFAGARLVPQFSWSNGGFQSMSAFDPSDARVRYVEPVENGRIQIVLDETRQRTVSGRLDDQNIRALLLGATRDEADPGLRAVTVGLLTSRAQASDVRDALVYALGHDQNAGVRLKALQGLKPFAQAPEVRNALEAALLTDSNPGLRAQAIDLLTQNAGGDMENLDRQIIGTLQQLMLNENNAYVRQRSQRALESLHASPEIY